ncbi:MAG: hypothetical protein K8S56_03425 [Candidatus Cloacimonetes bacterium]|nr:hypothetical protein [Candidatus Cloacimonadota bacterium]
MSQSPYFRAGFAVLFQSTVSTAFNPHNAVKIQKMGQTCLPEEHKNLTLNIFKYAMKFLDPSRYTSSPPFSNPTTLNGMNIQKI